MIVFGIDYNVFYKICFCKYIVWNIGYMIYLLSYLYYNYMLEIK